jgi:hypothetical protein
MGPIAWMILNGFSMYLAYIAYHTFLFERWIALFRHRSNIGFLMYIADAFGYLGSVGTLFLKELTSADVSWFAVFTWLAYATGTLTTVLGLVGWLYFRRREAAFSSG